MIIFQNKIIYMPSIPPFSRSEKASDYAAQCKPVIWKEHKPRKTAIHGVVLGTPFVDIKSMLVALYPQKFLPYRYLHPFLRSSWDSGGTLRRVAAVGNISPPRVLILEAGDDEIVPAGQAEILEQMCSDGGIACERKVVKGALHTELMARHEGRSLVASFLKTIAQRKP